MTTSAIVADNLQKRFGEVKAVQGISLAVPKGTVLGLLGANGAGKTTMVRMFTTVLRPDGGVATVNGFDVVRQAQAVRNSIGLAGQFAAIDENLTGRENIVLVGRLNHLNRTDATQRSTVSSVKYMCSTTASKQRPASAREFGPNATKPRGMSSSNDESRCNTGNRPAGPS